MNPNSEDTELAKRLRDDPRSEKLLGDASEAIANGRGEKLLFALNDKLTANGTETTAVSATMALLETMMETAPRVAEYLMIKLYPIASSLFMHDVCDAIELWLLENASPELASLIGQLANEEKDPLTARRMLEWANGMPKPLGTHRE